MAKSAHPRASARGIPAKVSKERLDHCPYIVWYVHVSWTYYDLNCGPARLGRMVAGFFQADHLSNRVDLMHVENRIKEGDCLVPVIC